MQLPDVEYMVSYSTCYNFYIWPIRASFCYLLSIVFSVTLYEERVYVIWLAGRLSIGLVTAETLLNFLKILKVSQSQSLVMDKVKLKLLIR